MIVKPTSLSPSAETVSIDDNTIEMSAQVLAGSSLESISGSSDKCYASLIFNDGDNDYIFSCDPTKISSSSPKSIVGNLEYLNTSIKVSFDLDISNSIEYVLADKYEMRSSKTSTDLNHSTNQSLSLTDLLYNGAEASWKLRLFDKNSLLNSSVYRATTQIAYGSVSTVTRHTEDAVAYTRFMIFPHTSIYMDSIVCPTHTQMDNSIDTVNYNNIKSMIDSILKNYDSNMRYYIEVGGQQYPIKYYSFIPGWQDEELSWDDYFDGYGNPINGYVEIEGSITNVVAGDTYRIYCNYIDSKQTYFDIYADPTITIKENLGQTLNESNSSLDSPYVISYCNLSLSIDFTQAQGLYANYYNYSVSKYDNTTGLYEFVYSSGNLYNQQMVCNFDKLMPESTYKITINIIDSQRRTYTRELYFKTDYSSAQLNVKASADYYEPHNSIIIDWSEVESILPTGDISDLTFVNLDDDGTITTEISTAKPYNAVFIPDGKSLTYTTNDSGDLLSLQGTTMGLVFKGTDLTNGVIAVISDGEGCFVIISYNNGILKIQNTSYCYEYSLYGDYTQDDLITALETQNIDNIDKPVPFIWGDTKVLFNSMEWDDSYWWHEDDLISKYVFEVVVDSTECAVKNVTTNTILQGTSKSQSSVYTSVKFVSLLGETYYKRLYVVYNDGNYNVSDLINGSYEDWAWDNENTRILCKFENSVNGSASNVEWSNIAGFRVYKTLGESDYLYEIANIEGTSNRILEDFAVGDNCEYTYYIYPLIKNTDSSGDDNGTYYLGTVIETTPIMLDEGIDKVFGLKELKNSDGTYPISPVYEVDLDQVWRLRLNLEDTGYTIHVDQTFYDTLATYTQEYRGNRKYISKSIKALIGDIDCSFDDSTVLDTYDMLVSWNDFSTSNNAKCFVDKRGLILPGNFESDPSIEYLDAKGSPATASFTWRQKSDLHIISIYARVLPFNPLKELSLASSEMLSLLSSDPDYLTVERQDE